MSRFEELEKKLDRAIEEVQGTPRHPNNSAGRNHLGASIIGRECQRELVYSFRKAFTRKFSGSMLRLFDRGHEEEARFTEFLAMIGIVVDNRDPTTIFDLWHDPDDLEYIVAPRDNPGQELLCNWVCVTDSPEHVAAAFQRGIEIPKPKQYRFKGYKGHFAGSLDGIATGVPGLEKYGLSTSTRILVEYKTHGEDSWKDLVKQETVQISKVDHWFQMQSYLHGLDLPGALYCAVRKATDEIWFEFVPRVPHDAVIALRKAQEVIDARILPRRIPNASASFFKCILCDYRLPCHFGIELDKSCRTCRSSCAIDDGKWHCDRWGKTIPDEAIAKGCDHWAQIHD